MSQSVSYASHPWLHRYAVLTAGLTFFLLIAGGLVTSTDSGLAVPDWPLSYGTWFPPMVGGIRYEHGHRMIAGVVGLLILGLALWLWRVEPRRWVRRLGAAALLGVVAQALLGGLTVVLLLPPAVSIAHACLGPAVCCMVTAVARCTALQWHEDPAPIEDQGRPSVRVLGLGVGALAFVQLLLGAVIRHTGMGILAHAAGALWLVALALWLARRLRCGGFASAQGWAWRLVGLLGLQLGLGVGVLGHRGSVGWRTAHHAVGLLLVIQAVLLAWELWRARTVAPAVLGPAAARPEASP